MLDNLFNIVRLFEMTSGLNINHLKSKFIGLNLGINEVNLSSKAVSGILAYHLFGSTLEW